MKDDKPRMKWFRHLVNDSPAHSKVRFRASRWILRFNRRFPRIIAGALAILREKHPNLHIYR